MLGPTLEVETVVPERLSELRSILIDLERLVVDLLRPGSDERAIRARLGPDTPAEVVQWFGWADGVTYEPGQIQDDVCVIPGYTLPSLDEAADMIPHFSFDELLGPQWVPLLVTGGGDFYAGAWTDERDLRIVDFLIDEPTEVAFPSADQMLEVFLGCYRQEAFYVDESGMLTMSPALYEAVHESIVRA